MLRQIIEPLQGDQSFFYIMMKEELTDHHEIFSFARDERSWDSFAWTSRMRMFAMMDIPLKSE